MRALLFLGGCVGQVPGAPLCEAVRGTVRCAHETMRFELEKSSRQVHWQVPLGEAPAAGWPAALVFQGAGFPASLSWSSPNPGLGGTVHQVELTGTLLDAGFAVLTPEAAGEGLTCWDTNLPPWSGDWESAPDADLMEALLEGIEAGDFGPIDPTDLHAAGISSGGYMTSRMALSYPGRFSSLAIVAGSWATCAGVFCEVPDELPEPHPPTLFLHGSLDAVVPAWTMRPYANGLVEQGTPVTVEMFPLTAHGWPADAPEAIADWMNAFRQTGALQ